MSLIFTTIRSVAACGVLLAAVLPAGAATDAASTLAAATLIPGTPKSNGPGTIVRARPVGTAVIGQPLEITIDFSKVGGPETPKTTVRFTSDTNLTLTGAKTRKLPPGSSSITIIATPTADGLGHVNVYTRQGTAGTGLSIPIRVGAVPVVSPQQKSTSPLGAGPNGEPVQFIRVP